MEITRNALENLMDDYVKHKKTMMEYECNHESIEEYENDPEYMFHKGSCETAKMWMRSIEVSPECNFITDKLCNEC